MKKLIRIFILLSALSLSANQSLANIWQIDKAKSNIEFFGTGAENNFTGKFDDIAGEIEFDPAKLDKSFAKIKINLQSAKTGNQTYDKTLLGEDWLNSKNNSFATYETKKISRIKGDDYNIEGFLTIKNIKIAHNFKANIKIDKDKAYLNAKTEIKRLNFNIGKASDSTGRSVSLNIPVKILLTTTLKK